MYAEGVDHVGVVVEGLKDAARVEVPLGVGGVSRVVNFLQVSYVSVVCVWGEPMFLSEVGGMGGEVLLYRSRGSGASASVTIYAREGETNSSWESEGEF